MLQGNQDRNDDRFIFWAININAVFIVNGKHFLPDHGDDLLLFIVQFKVQPDDISPQLPAQALYIGNVLEQMQKLVGDFKLRAIRHGDEMAFVQGEEFPLDMRHLVSLRVGYIRFIMQGRKLSMRMELLFLSKKKDQNGNQVFLCFGTDGQKEINSSSVISAFKLHI